MKNRFKNLYSILSFLRGNILGNNKQGLPILAYNNFVKKKSEVHGMFLSIYRKYFTINNNNNDNNNLYKNDLRTHFYCWNTSWNYQK